MDTESAIRLRWLWIPVRVLLLTFLSTLLAFAVSLLLGIASVIALAELHHEHPNMTLAYRDFALPVAIVAGIVALISFVFIEVRRYRQLRTLAAIERSSSSLTFTKR
jgi:hypothetical protein